MAFLGEKRLARARGGIVLAALLTIGMTTIGIAGVGATSASAAESDTIGSLVNQARASSGLPALRRNASMDAVAQRWAQQMAANNSMSHNPSYSSQIPRGWSRAGENVATGFPSPQAMHDGWMNSAGHRANILGDYTDIGIAYYVDANGVSWGVEDFGKYGAAAAAPAPAAAAPAARPAPAAHAAPARPAPARPAPAAKAAPAPAAVAPAPAAAPAPPAVPPAFVPIPTAAPKPAATATAIPKPGYSAKVSAGTKYVNPKISLTNSSSAIPSDGIITVILAIVILSLLAFIARMVVTFRKGPQAD